MYDSAFNPPPPIYLEKPKQSVLGIVSFVASLVSLLSVCALFIVAGVLGSQASNYGDAGSSTMAIVAWAFICVIGISCLLGVGLGIAAVAQRGTNKVFGILGLVFSSLVLLGFCACMLFSVILGLSLAA